MNTANLQIEGLLMAMAEVHRLLIAKGMLTGNEVQHALRQAEARLVNQERSQELSPANRDAIVFPLRLLRLALDPQEGDGPDFADLAKRVGETKQPYNDQR